MVVNQNNKHTNKTNKLSAIYYLYHLKVGHLCARRYRHQHGWQTY